MSRRDYASVVVGDFCGEMGLPALPLDEDGRLSLKVDDTRVTLRHVTFPMEQLTVLIDLGKAPGPGTPGLTALLELNLVAWVNGNMTIGLTVDGKRVLGRNTILVSKLDHATLRSTLVPMLAAAPAIRDAIADLKRTMPTGADDTGPGRGDLPPDFMALRV